MHKKCYFIDCEKKQIEGLLSQLNIYKLRSNIEIMNLSNEFVVAAFSYEKFMTFDRAIDVPGSTIKYNEDIILLDPRNKILGGRLIINLEKLYLSLKKLNLKSVDQQEYYKFSYNLGIAQKETNKLRNKLFGIECNFEELNGIDFKKGCYIGQENTSRIKLRNKLLKRLLPIEIVKGEIKEGVSILYQNKEVGKILINNNYPFGLIKCSNNEFDFKNEFKTEKAIIKIRKPDWIQK